MEASQHSLLAACFTLHSINATIAIVPQRGAGLWMDVPNDCRSLGKFLLEQRWLLTLIDRRECEIQCTLIAGLASLHAKNVKRLQENYDVTSIICVTNAKTEDVQIIFHGIS
jgi:hypothetical protein